MLAMGIRCHQVSQVIHMAACQQRGSRLKTLSSSLQKLKDRHRRQARLIRLTCKLLSTKTQSRQAIPLHNNRLVHIRQLRSLTMHRTSSMLVTKHLQLFLKAHTWLPKSQLPHNIRGNLRQLLHAPSQLQLEHPQYRLVNQTDHLRPPDHSLKYKCKSQCLKRNPLQSLDHSPTLRRIKQLSLSQVKCDHGSRHLSRHHRLPGNSISLCSLIRLLLPLPRGR